MPPPQGIQDQEQMAPHYQLNSRPVSMPRSRYLRPSMSLGPDRLVMSQERRVRFTQNGRSMTMGYPTVDNRVMRGVSSSRSWIPEDDLRGQQSEDDDEMRRDHPEEKADGDYPHAVMSAEPKGWSAEDIARRRFNSTITDGPGMPVLKHNRNKGRSRRVLRFNAEEKVLTWTSTFPTYTKTHVPVNIIQSIRRGGTIVKVSIKDQGDVGFQCSRLTDAIVLETGLACVIRDLKSHIDV